MKEKKLIPIIDLDSKDFQEKVLYSLDKADGVGTIIPTMGGRDTEMKNLLFLMMNSRVSQRKRCKACGGYHWHFVKEFEGNEYKDKAMLCSSCGSLMVLMAIFGTDGNLIKKWMKGNGAINPLELIKDGIEKFIKEGKIKVSKE